ncbi:MAG: PorV/PorQ family protein [Rhodothermaceae bacterium]|nr:PorV/PorQ family protein [Rhodothermaceae bacterium]
MTIDRCHTFRTIDFSQGHVTDWGMCIKGAILLLLALLLTAFPAQAQSDYGFDFEKTGSAGFQALKIGIGARESALGEAASSLTNDANAVFWNVGALPLVSGPTVYLTHNEWLVNSRVDALVAAVPVNSYTFGLSVMNFGIESYEETTATDPEGTGRQVSAGDLMVGLAAARRFTDRLTIGLQVKYVREQLDQDVFSNVLFDVGTLYFTGFRQMRLAFTIQHFGASVSGLRESFRMPLLFRMSVADDLVDTDAFRLSSSFELVHPTDNNEWVNWGIETVFLDMLSLRAGYRFQVDEGDFSLGAGLALQQIAIFRLNLDYAYVPFGDLLGVTHRITLGLSRR